MEVSEKPHLDAVAGLKWLRAQIRPRAGRTLVGIDGVDGSGKTSFADELADLLRESGLTVIRISLDNYLNAQEVRYAQGRRSAKGYFEDTYDKERFLNDVLEPLRSDGSGCYRTAAYDFGSETPVKSPMQVAPDDAAVIVDGMFLHRPEYWRSASDKVWNISVWLDVPFAESYRRMAERDGINPDPRDPSNSRYYQGQLLYIAKCEPEKKADIVVDNSGPHDQVD
ncbi:MAG: uridine kinase [Propionibacteriaceae bacterium]|nr:uridine kinase [Propionibacteriaceae bacterium]